MIGRGGTAILQLFTVGDKMPLVGQNALLLPLRVVPKSHLW